LFGFMQLVVSEFRYLLFNFFEHILLIMLLSAS
jgi:hypothetical protein